MPQQNATPRWTARGPNARPNSSRSPLVRIRIRLMGSHRSLTWPINGQAHLVPSSSSPALHVCTAQLILQFVDINFLVSLSNDETRNIHVFFVSCNLLEVIISQRGKLICARGCLTSLVINRKEDIKQCSGSLLSWLMGNPRTTHHAPSLPYDFLRKKKNDNLSISLNELQVPGIRNFE